MVDRPRWSTRSLVRIRRDGLIRAMRPGGDAPTEPDAPPQQAAAGGLRRNSVPVFHIACSTTASLRATATRAFLRPPALGSRRPQSLRAQGLVVRVSRVVA